MMNYRLLALTLAVAACGRGSGGSPTCGIAFLAGPSLITQQLGNARAVLTDPPRGVPDSLPALVILQKTRDIGAVLVGRYGVRVDWASVSNPRCPLFGGPATQTS